MKKRLALQGKLIKEQCCSGFCAMPLRPAVNLLRLTLDFLPNTHYPRPPWNTASKGTRRWHFLFFTNDECQTISDMFGQMSGIWNLNKQAVPGWHTLSSSTPLPILCPFYRPPTTTTPPPHCLSTHILAEWWLVFFLYSGDKASSNAKH